jgi:ketosteroid isomerase-like protein
MSWIKKAHADILKTWLPRECWMRRAAVAAEDRRSIADWFSTWGQRVAKADFAGVRGMFAQDTVAFGSKVEMVTTLDVLEAEQWRAVWPTIENYHYDLSTLEVIMSPDRLMAVGAAIFRSTGFHDDGSRFDRPGRVTASLMRSAIGAPWIATHTHVSLKPGTPTPSYGNRRRTD